MENKAMNRDPDLVRQILLEIEKASSEGREELVLPLDSYAGQSLIPI